MNEENSFLGTGWSFPPTFDEKAGTVKMLSEVEDIESSLEILLSTRPGERVMQPTYGCNLDFILFEPLDATLKTFMADLVQTAILYHEPRIDAQKITLNTDHEAQGVVLIEIAYRVRSTNSRQNFVYPFYKAEGTENQSQP